MTSTQQKYSIYDQELLALITALDKWSHLLRVSKVNVYTDHQALTYLQRLNNSKPLRGRTARWLDFLAEFPNLTITYLPGSRNQVADALSRTPHLITEDVSSNKAEPTESPVEPLLLLTNAACSGVVARNTRGRLTDYRRLAGIRSGSANETVQGKQDRVSREDTQPPPKPLRPENSESREEIPQPESTPQSAGDLQQTQQQSENHPLNSPQQHHITPKYVLDWPRAYIRCPVFKDPYLTAAAAEGKIVQIDFQHRKYPFRYVRPYLRVCYNGLWLICVPQFPEFMTHLLYTHHDHVTAGHRGQRKTYEALSRRYYWPGMRKYTNAYVESCTQCRASKTTNQKPAGLLQQLMIPSRRWSHVSLDFITDLPRTTTGNDAVLVLVDSLSKMAHFIPTKKAITAAETVVLLADRLVRYHGFPDVLISDRDPRFTSEIWEKLCTHFHIRRAMSSPCHPQTDGQTERVNRTLEQMLRTYIQADEREWEILLPALELAYNTTHHSSTELSPFEVMIGENPVTGADLDLVGSLSPTLSPPMTKLFRQLCDRAQAHILRAKWRQKYYADTRRRPVVYKEGDQVWISTKNLPALNYCSKFEPRYRGPFQIKERIGEVAYRIALPATYEGHDVFHVSQLVPHHPRPASHTPQDVPVGWPPVRDATGRPTDQYLVDYILDQRGRGDSLRYLVKWRGAPEECATWEPAHHLQGCPALLRAWKKHRRKVLRHQRDDK